MKELSDEAVETVSGGNDFLRLEIYAGTYLDPRTNPGYWREVP